jgi:hypothetical protein
MHSISKNDKQMITVPKAPKADGTFIQADMVKNWDEEKWMKEFRYLSEAEMHYLVLAAPDKLGRGVVDMCLKTAQKSGFKVFLGIQYNDAWWKKGRDKAWLFEQMRISCRIADNLYEKYHSKYSDAFYGWYFAYEVDNVKFNSRKKFKLLAEGMGILLEHLRINGHRLPIMLSPFMKSAWGKAKDYAANWAWLFNATELGEGDIFCPQDSIGSGGLKMNELDEWFWQLKKAVETKPGLQFWANTENFDHRYWSSAPLNRFLKQMGIVSSYVDNIITFSYSHYYSPNNIDGRLHEMYLYYLKTGRLPEAELQPPAKITVKRIGLKGHRIAWEEVANPTGVFGYELFRNGKKIFGTYEQRIYGGKSQGKVLSFVDRNFLMWRPWGIVYEVRALDFAGNASKKIKARVFI